MDPEAPEFVYTGATVCTLRQKQEQEEEPQGLDDMKTKAASCESKEEEVEPHEYEDTSTIKAASCDKREKVEFQDFQDPDNDANLSDCGDLTRVPQYIFVPADLEKISAQEARRRRYRGSGYDQYGRWHRSNVPPKVVILPDRVFYRERRTTEDEKAYVVEGQPWVPGPRRRWTGNLVTAGPELVGALDVTAMMPRASVDAQDFAWMPHAPVFEPKPTTRQNLEEGAAVLPFDAPFVPGLLGVTIDDPALVESSPKAQEVSPPCGFFPLNAGSTSTSLRLFGEQLPQLEDPSPLSLQTELSFPDPDFSTAPDFSTLEKAFVDKVMRWTEIEDKGKVMGKEILTLKKRTQAQEVELDRLRNNYEALLKNQQVSKEENEEIVGELEEEVEKISKELKSYEEHEVLKVEHEKMFKERKVHEELEDLKQELKQVSEELSTRKEMEAARFQRLADFQKSLQHRTFLTDAERRTLFMTAQQLQKGWGLERLVNQHRMDQYYSAKVQEDRSIIAELGCKVVELNSELMRLNAQVERLLDDSLEDINSLFEEDPSSNKVSISSQTEPPALGQATCQQLSASPILNQEIQHLCSWCSKTIARPLDWTRKGE